MLKFKGNKGITLIALVITIIVLLILAGITIATLTNSGLFNKTKVAKEKYTFEAAQEQLELDMMNFKMQKYIDGGTYPTLNELKTYLEDSKFNGEYEVELAYEPLATTETTIVPLYAKVIHIPTQFIFYVDGKLVVIGGKNDTVAKKFTITYLANGGTGTMGATTGENPEVATNCFIAPERKKFSKWNTSSNGTGTDYNIGSKVSQNITLYAMWEDINYIYDEDKVDEKITISNVDISESGIVEFSKSNAYIQLNQKFLPETSTWTVATKFYTTVINNQYQPVIGKNGAYNPALIYIINGKLHMFAGSTDNSWNIAITNGTTTISSNTWYWIIFRYTGTKYECLISTDGINYNSDISVETELLQYQKDSILFGSNPFASEQFYGKIDLKETYVKIGNEYFFNGLDYFSVEE